MKRTTVALGGVALRSMFLALCVLSAASAAELSPRELKKNLKQAEKAWNVGQAAAAVELYEGILDATEPGAAERAGALYVVGMASLGGEDDGHTRARELFAELVEKFPRHPRSGSAKAIDALLGALEEARAEGARLTGELKATVRSDREASESRASEAAELREKLAQGEADLAAAQAEIAELKPARERLARREKEIADCEEKLKKVRETLVGGGG